MTIKMIVAMGINNEIGKGNQLLWNIPADLKHFKKTTSGKTVVMGRKTYESIGKALPNRKNIVLSRTFNPNIKGCYQTTEIDDILSLHEDVYVIGGEQIYNLFMPHADELIVSHVLQEHPDADAFFPKISNMEWYVDKVDISHLASDFYIVHYKRRVKNN